MLLSFKILLVIWYFYLYYCHLLVWRVISSNADSEQCVQMQMATFCHCKFFDLSLVYLRFFLGTYMNPLGLHKVQRCTFERVLP